MIETLLPSLLVTNISPFPESYVTPSGAVPIGIVAETVFVVSFMTKTVPSF